MKENHKFLGKSPSNTSVINLSKSLIEEINHYIPQEYQSTANIHSDDHFIPFVNERDGLNRLIFQKPHTIKAKKSLPEIKIEKTPKKKKKLAFGRVRKSTNPAVGSYYKPENWIKPTFSNWSLLNLSSSSTKHSTSNSEIEIKNFLTPNKHKKSTKFLFPDLRRGSNGNDGGSKITIKKFPRQRGIWEDFKLVGGVEEIKEEIRQASDYNFVLNHHYNIRKVMHEMKKKIEY